MSDELEGPPAPDMLEVDFDKITRNEFIELAAASKAQLLEALAAEMLVIGFACAEAQADYYRTKLGPDKSDLAEVTALRNRLDVRLDTIKHVVSAIQSAIKVDRIL